MQDAGQESVESTIDERLMRAMASPGPQNRIFTCTDANARTSRAVTVALSDISARVIPMILTSANPFWVGQAPVNKLVPATSPLWALQESRFYYYDFKIFKTFSETWTLHQFSIIGMVVGTAVASVLLLVIVTTIIRKCVKSKCRKFTITLLFQFSLIYNSFNQQFPLKRSKSALINNHHKHAC